MVAVLHVRVLRMFQVLLILLLIVFCIVSVLGGYSGAIPTFIESASSGGATPGVVSPPHVPQLPAVMIALIGFALWYIIMLVFVGVYSGVVREMLDALSVPDSTKDQRAADGAA